MTTKDVLALALEALEKYSLPIDENNLALSCIEYGSDSVGTELLRRKAVAAIKQAQEPTDCKTCNGTGAMDSGGAYPWGEQISVPCYCQAPAPKQAQEPVDKCVTWTTGPNEWKDWCAQWFGPDADDDYLAKAVFALPPMAQNFKLTAPKQAEPSWQPIESAPKDGTEFLGWWGPEVGKPVITYWLDNSKTRTPWAGWRVPSMQVMSVRSKATHWMPLPTPPEAK